jgi:hypothetical protein
MKCEICNFQESPDNLEKLAVQAETCGNPTCKTAKIVWRDGQMILTTSPTSDEMIFDVTIRDLEPAPPPPIVHYSLKLTAPGGLISEGTREDKRND